MRISTWFLAFPLMFAVACDDGTDDTDMGTEIDTDTDTDTDSDSDSDSETVEDIDIAGTYTDNFGGSQIVSNERWISGDYEFALSEFDNEAAFALAQNDADNEFSPDLFSRFDWSMNTVGNVVYCQSVFDGATLEDARAGFADSNDLDAGCGGFGWSVLTEVE